MSGLIRYVGALVLLTAALALTGCPNDASEGGAVDTCEKIGQQCKLGGGQLGVCTMDPGGEMRCEPQH
ncbi:MAG: hypothetical protein ACQEVA_21235 [Myxococcota bacterium]